MLLSILYLYDIEVCCCQDLSPMWKASQVWLGYSDKQTYVSYMIKQFDLDSANLYTER